MKEIIKCYLNCLVTKNYNQLMSIFDENAIVHSPLYGKCHAAEFYKGLFQDTQDSKIQLLDIFTNE